ncbi:hypothetical protein F8388_019545 [Cannabis sativa]|uniref:Ferrochelatase n=1 Tax=Cannabis sativa TaxID=3483 RepID=A0A7J6FHU0_CANSA|nr:hypothetical protein F8388_019545 [Cannabis sativa]KAF4384417.1 hypothetical protein G4B88_028491 [Cannabis sativa]
MSIPFPNKGLDSIDLGLDMKKKTTTTPDPLTPENNYPSLILLIPSDQKLRVCRLYYPYCLLGLHSTSSMAESIAMLPWSISSAAPLDHRVMLRANCSSQKLERYSGTCTEASFSRLSSTQPSLLFSNSKKSRLKCLPPLNVLVDSETQAVPAKPLVGNDKIGVLLLNLGGPETLDDVQPFLFNLFADPVKLHFLTYMCIII